MGERKKKRFVWINERKNQSDKTTNVYECVTVFIAEETCTNNGKTWSKLNRKILHKPPVYIPRRRVTCCWISSRAIYTNSSELTIYAKQNTLRTRCYETAVANSIFAARWWFGNEKTVWRWTKIEFIMLR